MSVLSAVLLKSGNGVIPEPVVVNGLEDIQSWVGGYVEAVRVDAQQTDGSGKEITLVGYCHEEGLVRDMEMNWLASALFKTQIRGNVVVVASDGGEEDCDVPDILVRWLMTTFTHRVVDSYNQASVVSAMLEYALENNLVPKEEIAELMEAIGNDIDNDKRTDAVTDKLNTLLEKLTNAISNDVSQEDSEAFVSDIENYLKSETEK